MNQQKSLIPLWIGFLFVLCICQPLHAQLLKEKNQIIVAYYGRPGVSSLGVLGQYTPDELVPVIKEKAQEYKNQEKSAEVIPAFDIIYGLATAAPGGKKDYIANLSEDKLAPYLEIVKKEGFMLFIDLQLGNNAPVDAVRGVLPYLKYKNVHIAIDPEFEVLGLGKAPGKVIGSITGEDVNQVQQLMQNYLEQEGIKEEKFLVVHMFTDKMVKQKSKVKLYDQVNLIMNLDGHGSPRLKINIYNGLYSKKAAEIVSGGFKLFFKEDSPMMTPRQVLGLESVDGGKVDDMPRFINFQ